MLTLSFYVPGEAIGLGRQKTKALFGKDGKYNRILNYKPGGSATYENKVATCASEAMEKAGHSGVTRGPVKVSVTIEVVRPKNHFRSGKNSHLLKDDAPAIPTGKPDIDNVLKGVMDAMTGIVYADDKQVFSAYPEKFYESSAGLRIRVTEVSNHIPDDVRFNTTVFGGE